MTVKDNITEQQALQRLTLLCSQGEHCQHEMLEKMQKWALPEDAQARIMAYLIDERYVDDVRYCRGFIHDKREYNHWGQRKIEQALWAKGIGKDIYGPIFADVDDDVWTDVLRPLLQQKRRTVKGRNEYEINQKLLRFALGRGFSFSQAKACLGCDVDEDYDYDE